MVAMYVCFHGISQMYRYIISWAERSLFLSDYIVFSLSTNQPIFRRSLSIVVFSKADMKILLIPNPRVKSIPLSWGQVYKGYSETRVLLAATTFHWFTIITHTRCSTWPQFHHVNDDLHGQAGSGERLLTLCWPLSWVNVIWRTVARDWADPAIVMMQASSGPLHLIWYG